MQIVIDIDENVFTRLFDNGTEDYEIANDDLCVIAKAIRKGIPLPKGHGRLIDADAMFKDICNSIESMTNIGIAVDGQYLWEKLNDALFNASTIIKADKTERSEEV